MAPFSSFKKIFWAFYKNIIRWLLWVGLAMAAAYMVMAGMFHIMLKNELAKNPALVTNALIAWQQQQKQTAGNDHAAVQPDNSELLMASYKKIIADDRHGFMGNPQGTKILVEFFDYNCPYCQKQYINLEQLIKKDSAVKVVLVELPILSQSSVDAAFLSSLVYQTPPQTNAKKNNETKRNPAAYQRFHRAVLLGQHPLSRDGLYRAANAVGFTPKKIKKEDEGRVKIFLQSNITLANKLHIQGTPAFIYKGTLHEGLTETEDLARLMGS
ncbi:MAG: thioredoxin domain-containing protein [Alphaproteobacteria bacterium]|nr:thioredoxin domain-containing protein [Alphaproteobacteria bacterium]